MTSFFKTKEQYLAFRSAWAAAVNDNRSKSSIREVQFPGTRRYSAYTYTIKEPGWITGAHMMLYNILRGKDLLTGFSPVTNKARLSNGAHINHGAFFAYQKLSAIVRAASMAKDDNRYSVAVEKFLEPFKGTVTVEMLQMIKFEERDIIKPISTNYKPGLQIAHGIIHGHIEPPKTVRQLLNILKK